MKKQFGYLINVILMAFFIGSTVMSTATAEDKKKVEYLYVQTAHAVTFKGNIMTLHGVNANTVFFSDRPDRIAGHGTTVQLIKEWNQGEDSFSKTPPNATLSILESDEAIANIVVVLSNPKLEGSKLTYTIKVLEGKPPSHGGARALFIDVIGRPLSPVSVAGAARREVRR